jgi:kynurenine formamidase
MNLITLGASALAVTLAMAMPALADAHAKKSPFGPEDQAGRSNLMTPAKAMEATKLMKTGTVLSLGRDYEAAMPLFGSRAFALRATGGLAGGPFGENKVIWNDDFLATEIGQVGTQFDGLSHIGIHGEAGAVYYNGLTGSDIHGPQGMKALGVEHVKPFFTRGVLIDMVGLLGRNMKLGEEISAAQLTEALDKQGTAMPTEGDVVIFHTGWGDLWIKDNEKFNSGAPGIGLEAAQVLIEAGVALVGSDTWPVEVVPNPNSSLAFPVHQEFLTKNGIFIHENLASERLAEAGVYEFAYIYAPVPIVGATGSPGAPLAVY